jgi:hypothetical protein
MEMEVRIDRALLLKSREQRLIITVKKKRKEGKKREKAS